ncbi:hypothetical protein N0V90_003187 [Kalmusia sp. IMI 367209]|nr:hypothetical protein N0V90_003187 [Kalmusia sp. IMI 367209]
MPTAQQPVHPPGHHMVFTIPRTASHLLLKLLNLPTQPSLYRHSNNLDGYIFFPAASPRFKHSLPGKPIQEWTDDQKSALRKMMQASFDDWLHLIAEAEKQGKSTFVKEHLHWMIDPLAEARVYGYQNDSSIADNFQVDWKSAEAGVTKNEYNVTCLPDAFLQQRVKPTFLIRHPALTFPSSLRTAIDIQGIEAVLKEEKIHQWECTYHWSLALYKFYTQSASDIDRKSFVDGVEYPIVLDAQDLGDEALVKKYAKAVGLDDEKVQFAWEAAGEEEFSGLGKMEKRMKSTILASSGIEKGKLDAGDMDIEKLSGVWKEEFGEALSQRLVKLVNDTIDAYESLKNVRLRV